MSRNRSLTYFLFYMTKYVDFKFIDTIINTYMFYNKEYKFCIEYQFSGKKEFTDYEAALTKNEYYVGTIDISITNVIYIFDIPDDLFIVIELFIEGKYSKLPMKDELKDFLRKEFAIPQNHKINHILDRSEDLKKEIEDQLGLTLPDDIDLAEAPSIEKEELNIKKNEDE